MSLVMKPESRWWYARRVFHGRRRLFKLEVPIEGVRPATLRLLGDAAFEASRRIALSTLERKSAELGISRDAEWYRRMYEMLTERSVRPDPLPLAGLLDAWRTAPHARNRSARYLERAAHTVAQFLRIVMALPNPPRDVADISHEHAEGWALAPEIASLAPGTFNPKLILLRSVLWSVRRRTGITANPMAAVPMKHDEPVHRVPMTPDEVRRLVAASDPVLRGPLVTAACTAMRLGDCCRLTWESVDLDGGWITMRTQKTGEPVRIPMLPMLRRELTQRRRDAESTRTEEREDAKGAKDGPDSGLRTSDLGHVWPEAWTMYEGNRAGLSYRMRRAFAAAGIERTAVRGGATSNIQHPTSNSQCGTRKGAGAKGRASVRDFHALRTTWITTAIQNGMPMDLVRKVTGHRTVDVVLKHYLHPQDAALKKSVGKALGGLGR